MTFLEVLDGAEILSQSGDATVTGVQYDSRLVRPGDLFVAMRGESADGNRFIEAALAAGAAAVVSDSREEKPRPGVAWAQVPHGRRALARVSSNFYRRPAQKLAITGITGTNGKTTAAFLLESILRAEGRNTALIGTIEYHVAGQVRPAPHTTPEALELNALFAQAVAAGAKEVAMEVSSHALAQQRTYGVFFDVAVFTNLTRDHLDYHRDMDGYFAAKRVLFEGCGAEPPSHSVINVDDEYGERLLALTRSPRKLTYGITGHADFKAHKIEITPSGTRFDIAAFSDTIPVYSPMIGRVNVYNVLAAAAAAYARGCSPQAIEQGVAGLACVPGRFQRVDAGQPFSVVVDYAHTDDALRNLTALAREFVGRRGRVITLFGCGGDRDRNKRPLMGEAAGRGSDFVVVTSDNPRNEDPLAIIQDAVVGVQRSGVQYAIEPDRRKAIALALSQARAGDVLLIAGKGHEKVQVTRAGAAPFDDVEVATAALNQLGYFKENAPLAGSKA